jgi:hypothetical protein
MSPTIDLADWVWIATALLHRERPGQASFLIGEIVDRAERELRTTSLRAAIRAHVNLHCVAARAPSPARHRVLHAPDRARRRLWKPGDPLHPARIAGKAAPTATEIPEAHFDLLAWYSNEFAADPLLTLRGSGAVLWSDERTDEYVARLRAG